MGKGFVKSEEVVYRDEQGVERKKTTMKKFVYKTNEDPFYMVFINYIKWIYNIKSGATHLVLYYLLENCNYQTGEISLSTGKRADIMNKCQITKSSLAKAIKQLVDYKVISQKTSINEETGEIITQKGDYIVNPEMFWKGPLNARRALKVTFEADYDTEEDEFSNTESDSNKSNS